MNVRQYVLGAAIVALLAGCGGSQPPMGAQGTIAQISRASSDGYSVLHSFGGVGDGQQPKAALINVDGVLYGTTYAGGASANGTVFSVTPAGAEKVVYSFQGGNDGANPAAPLLLMKGLLYGTTEYGGIPSYGIQCNAGTVFSVNTSGAENVVYGFYGYYCHDHVYNDGSNPVAGLISIGDKLYGTTSNGGFNEFFGTAFRVSPRGNENVLHSFSVKFDGAVPNALIDVHGTLYGTTEHGGGTSSTSDSCCGLIYSMAKTGANVHILYGFHGYNGGYPLAGLVAINGTLYGTTAYGGPYYGGNAFSMTTSGTITILHNFGSGSDAAHPYAPLLKVGKALYGTTLAGGTYNEGTIFRMTLTGKEKVLHSFGSGSDGAAPLAGLLNVHGTLYGTTSAGGTQGYGTVFALRIK